MKKFPKALLLPGIILTLSQGGWMDSLGSIGDSLTKSTQSATTSKSTSLSDSKVADALKEALRLGSDEAVKMLGKKDGFYGNPLVRIPLPSKLESVASMLKKAGMGSYVDQFMLSMNRAAEAAVPKTTKILADTVTQMKLEDAKKILNGPEDAATTYFRTHAGDKLAAAIMPIVKEEMDKNNVTQYYKMMMEAYEKYGAPVAQNSYVKGLMNAYNGMQSGGEKEVAYDPKDLDGYVTHKALDGLYTMIAQKEKAIRESKAARTTKLLQEVFGK